MLTDSRAELAIAAAERGDFASASDVLINLVSEDWENVEAHHAWGHVLLAQGRATDAAAAFRTTVLIDPNFAEAHFDLATALLAEAEKNPFPALTNWLEARDAVREGLDRSPGDHRGTMLRAKIETQRAAAIGS